MQSLDGFRTEQMHEKKKESLSFARLEKDWARPSGVKEIEGKRSAHTKIISSPTMCPSFPRNLGTSFASGPISTCLEIKVQNIGRANKEGSSQNGKLNLVKGKKDVARKRVNLSFPNAKAAPRINLPTTTNWYTNIKKIQTNLNGEFKFCAKSRNEAGDHCGRTDCGFLEGDKSITACSPHSPSELVHRQTTESLDAFAPPHTDKCSIWISSSDRIHVSFSNHHGIQHPLDCHRDNDGCVGALCDIDAGQRAAEGIGEDDRMEAYGGSENSPSI